MADGARSFRIEGIISADRACECCGNSNLKKNVILEDVADGSLLYVGTTCAGYLLLGDKTRKSAEVIESHARAIEYARKWIGIHGRAPRVLRKIADAIRVRFCDCEVIDGDIVVASPRS